MFQSHDDQIICGLVSTFPVILDGFVPREKDYIQLGVVNYIVDGNGKPIPGISDGRSNSIQCKQ